MRTLSSLLGVVLVLALAVPCAAEDGASLYEAEAEVTNQSPEQRRQAVREALGKVLDRLSGEHDAAIAGKSREQVLNRAEHYVQQYGYTEQGLWVRFDRRALDELLFREQDAGSAAGSGTRVLMKVSGVRTLADYVRVTEYLAALKFTRGVQPVMIGPEEVLFGLAARGEPDAVVRAVGRDGFLEWLGEDTGIPAFLYSP